MSGPNTKPLTGIKTMSSTTRTPKMNLDNLIDALDGMDPSELASVASDILEAAEKMTAIDSPDNEIPLDAAEDRDGFELGAAKAIESDTLFCYYIQGEATGHAYCLGWNDGWVQCDSRQASEVSLDDLADADDALEYCDVEALRDGELTICVRKESDTMERTQTFAISSVDDVPFAEVADRLNEARRAGLGIDSDLLEKIKSLKPE